MRPSVWYQVYQHPRASLPEEMAHRKQQTAQEPEKKGAQEARSHLKK